MKFSRKDLDWAAETGVIAPEVRDALIAAFQTRYADSPSLSVAHVLSYLGGLIIIGAMTLYVSSAWEALGGSGHLAVALIYAGAFVLSGRWLWTRKGQTIPGGILITAAVCMTPMAIYGIQEMTGWWGWNEPGSYSDFYEWVRSGWFVMEVGTVLAGLVALKWFRFPFITLPIAFSLWFMSMDLTSVLYGSDFSWEHRKIVSIWFGLTMLIGSFLVDRRTEKDFAFWGYLFGLFAFWGGLTFMDSETELGRFVYVCLNLGLIGVSILVQRRVFIIFGGFGVCLYLGHLAYDVFENELLFAFALSGVGVAIIVLGLVYHRHQQAIERVVLNMVPESIRRTLPQFRS
ncbi:DUF2157 domain-containing protein [Pseudodesulfovibrio sp. JC047]|uniref:DUF2157 domain-containing protein n=1 Tax=Pseudodesulfovibrio sp. JC047 TaxID=2683199 RepID=UPI0013CF603E|nr:DUF2157 domain-containing protein [Pseudodesulfovibrio sp. JC047]NDV20089.1 DUF2157 domain-containing protein [Pseudodesulfovibrio sp. JC047]